MKDLLNGYVGSEIGLNLVKPTQIDTVKLEAVHASYFTVVHKKDGNIYHFPFLNIVKVIENPEGVTVGGYFTQKKTHPLVVKTGHIVDFIPM